MDIRGILLEIYSHYGGILSFSFLLFRKLSSPLFVLIYLHGKTIALSLKLISLSWNGIRSVHFAYAAIVFIDRKDLTYLLYVCALRLISYIFPM